MEIFEPSIPKTDNLCGRTWAKKDSSSGLGINERGQADRCEDELREQARLNGRTTKIVCLGR